jgi:hypothetical protein
MIEHYISLESIKTYISMGIREGIPLEDILGGLDRFIFWKTELQVKEEFIPHIEVLKRGMITIEKDRGI